MRPTPETDAGRHDLSEYGPHVPCSYGDWVPVDVAKRLERERDEAREELHDIRLNLGEDADGYTLLHAVCVIQNKMADALQDADLRTLDFERMKQERDIAEDERIDMAKQLESEKECHARCQNERDKALTSQEFVIAQHKVITELMLERDKAREKYATEATEHMLAVNKVCNERDEAREKLSARWQSLRDSQDEVLRLTFENRELSQSIEGWEALNKILKNE